MSESNEETKLPNTFTDAEGREWSLRITGADLEPLRKLAKLELHDLSLTIERCESLLDEPELYIRVMYSLCKRQAEAAGIAPEEFARGFWGDVLTASALALMGAVIDFFPMPAATRANLKARLATDSDQLPN